MEQIKYNKAMRNFTRLNTFFEAKEPVHFKTRLNTKLFNGDILDLSIYEFSLVIKDLDVGLTPILLEDISEYSIRELNEKEKIAWKYNQPVEEVKI
jgi:hypothetical protein